ncbi:unnamed protein product [Sphagnum balticum]
MSSLPKEREDLKLEACSEEVCNIQTCLLKNDFALERCKIPIKWLEKCCEAIEYKSKHCASVSNLLDMLEKRKSKKQQPPGPCL